MKDPLNLAFFSGIELEIITRYLFRSTRRYF